MQVNQDEYEQALGSITETIARKYATSQTEPVHAAPETVHNAARKLHSNLPPGQSLQATVNHLLHDVCPGLANNLSPKYFGFVTGGATPAAQLADILAVGFDQNVQVHLPDQSVSTTVEDNALCMLLELLDLSPEDWPGRTLTTGATASNVLGLGCGRTKVLAGLGCNINRDGFVKRVEILCVSPHASIKKAASMLGIGHANCIDLAQDHVSFDLEALGWRLKRNHGTIGSIVVAAIGEVNSGSSTAHLDVIRMLCDKYSAWLHIDAAFAVFAGLYPPLQHLLHGLHFADSLCVDGHKLLNVPYDTAFFYTRDKVSLMEFCSGGSAPYLGTVQSPLHVGIENSRRFRALPVYATLITYGREGYIRMMTRVIEFTRKVEAWMRESTYTVILYETNIILFTCTNIERVAEKINRAGIVYVTGTHFNGPAARIAVSNWRVGLSRNSNDESDDDFHDVVRALTVAQQ